MNYEFINYLWNVSHRANTSFMNIHEYTTPNDLIQCHIGIFNVTRWQNNVLHINPIFRFFFDRPFFNDNIFDKWRIFMLLNAPRSGVNDRHIYPLDSLIYLVFCFNYQNSVWINANGVRREAEFIQIANMPIHINISIRCRLHHLYISIESS